MAPRAYLIKPQSPTVAGDHAALHLLGTDVWLLTQIQYTIIIPEILDLSAFKSSLSATLSLFPEFAGRLVHDYGTSFWRISLVNAGIHLVVDYDDSSQVPPSDFVVLNGLDPFVPPIRIADLTNKDNPLAVFKLTFNKATRTTFIGCALSHTVGDGYQAHQFLRTLSRIYSGVGSDHTSNDRYFVNPDPSKQDSNPPNENSSEPSFWSSRHFTVSEAFTLYGQDAQRTSAVSIRLSTERIEKLVTIAKNAVSDGATSIKPKPPPAEVHALSTTSTCISRQDAVSAYVAALLAVHGERIEQIRNNFDYRNSAVPKSLVGTNAIAFIQTPVLSDLLPEGARSLQDKGDAESHNAEVMIEGEANQKLALLSVFAGEIRKSIMGARSPAFKDDLLVAQRTMLDVAGQGRCYCIVPPEGCFTVNGNANVEWDAVNFGYAGKTRFHTTWLACRYLRTFQSNPALAKAGSNDGQINILDDRKGWIDVQFGVPKEKAQQIQATIEKDMASLDTLGILT